MRAISYRDCWEECEAEHQSALTAAAHFRDRAAQYAGRPEQVADLERIATGKAHRAEVYRRLCAVLDLIMGDAELTALISAAHRRKREREAAEIAAGTVTSDVGVE